MKKTTSTIPLNLVKREILNSLDATAARIEAFHENKEAVEQIDEAIEQLSQVLGSVRVLNLLGASSLCEEIVALAQALKLEQVTHRENAFELLLGGLLFLPRYLEYVERHQKDSPVLVLSTINALKVARKAQIIPEHEFVDFDPYFVAQLHDQFVEPDSDLIQRGKRLRHMYQVGLLGVLKGSAINMHIKTMMRAIDRIAHLCGNQPLNEIWRLASALLEAARDNVLPTDTSMKMMFGAIDREIKRVLDGGSAVLSSQIDEDTRRHFLYYIAKTDSTNSQASGIREKYQLDNLVSSQTEIEEQKRLLAAPDQSVVTRVAEELLVTVEYVKERLDLFDRLESLSKQASDELMDQLKNMSETLILLELKQASATTAEIKQGFEKLFKEPNKDLVIDVADKLLSVEIAVNEFAHGDIHRQESAFDTNFNEAQNLALQGARTNMDDVKTSLDTYMDSFMDAGNLAEIPELLTEVRGVLVILGMERAGAAIQHCIRFVENQIVDNEHHPSDQQLELLADALASVEWYMEGFQQYHQLDNGMLDVAEESLAELLSD